MINSPREHFHKYNKNIRADGLNLSSTSSQCENRNFASINKDCYGGGGEEIEAKSNEGPFYPIEDYFQINFKDQIALFAFHLVKVSNKLLNYYGIIRRSSFFRESMLVCCQ